MKRISGYRRAGVPNAMQRGRPAIPGMPGKGRGASRRAGALQRVLDMAGINKGSEVERGGSAE